MANQTNNLLLLDVDGTTRTIDTATPDVIQLGVDFELVSGASLTVAGDFTVKGTTTTVETENVLIADNYLYLNHGYTTPSTETGGLVVNYAPTATTDTVAIGGFPTTSTVITTGSGTFSAGDIIQISGAADFWNDGVFEVVSHVGTTLTVATSPSEDWPQTGFAVNAGDSGAFIAKVNVAVLRAGPDGTWSSGSGSTIPLTYRALAERKEDYAYSVDGRVPASGSRFLDLGTIPSDLAPLTISDAGRIVGASVSVDTSDTNTYDLEILVNGSTVATLTLVAGTTSSNTFALSATVSAGDKLSTRMTRTAGSGSSTFKYITASVSIVS